MAKVFVSTIIDAPVGKVWEMARDFNGLSNWHSAVASSEIEGGQAADTIGCIRKLTMPDGGVIRERLLSLSDLDHSCTYGILEAPLPVENYTATLSFSPVTDVDKTYAQWTADFDSPDEHRDTMIGVISNGIFLEGLKSLAEKMA